MSLPGSPHNGSSDRLTISGRDPRPDRTAPSSTEAPPPSPYRPPELGRPLKDGGVIQYVHHYRGLDGGDIAYKVRVMKDGKKSFLWGRKGSPGLGGARPLLYGAETLSAIPAEEPIEVVEGEVCVEVMRAAGFHAVCSPHGASRSGWEELAPLLRDRIVRLWPDNDEPGRAHMAAAYRALAGVARDVLWVEIPDGPEGGDVADFLDRRSPEDLEAVLQLAFLRREAPPALAGDARVEPMAGIAPEDVTFIWDPYIPRGKLTLMEGDPGTNKSYVSLALAAGVTRGDRPDGSFATPECVLLLCAEDGLADTVRPRLEALGADLHRVHALTGLITEDGDAPFMLDADGVAALDRAVARIRPALVLIDPLFAFVNGRVDIYRANQVRAMLAPLLRLAEQHNCAIVGLRHLNKVGGANGITRGLGSIDFAAAARSVLLCSLDPHDPSKRVMSHTKSSLAPLGPALAFAIEGDAIAWLGVSDLRIEELLVPDADLTPFDEACQFLATVLANGSRPSRDVLQEARDVGIAERTLRRAVKATGVTAHRIGQPGGRRGKGMWIWAPPDADTPTAWEPLLFRSQT